MVLFLFLINYYYQAFLPNLFHYSSLYFQNFISFSRISIFFLFVALQICVFLFVYLLFLLSFLNSKFVLATTTKLIICFFFYTALKHSPSKRKSLSKAAQRSAEADSDSHRKLQYFFNCYKK